MRIVFGIFGLLIALAIVGLLAKQQLHALQPSVSTPDAASAPALSGTPAQQSQQLQRQVKGDIDKALQQGMQRNADAEAESKQ